MATNAVRWRWWGGGRALDGLPLPALAGAHQIDNAAACIAALDALPSHVRASEEAMRRGIATARIPGRLQWLDSPARVLLDVAHNPLGAEALAAYLAGSRPRARRHAVCGILGDKDAGAMLRALVHEIDRWYFASLPGTRGRDARQVAGELSGRVMGLTFDSVEKAFEAALEQQGEDDEIVVFGSFMTVERVLRLATSRRCRDT